MKSTMLRKRVHEAIDLYGSVRAAAGQLGIDYTYLYRLSTGEREDPSDEMLKKLGLKRVITFVSTRQLARKRA